MRDFPEVIHLERSDGEVVWIEGTPDSEEAETAVYRLDTGVISDVAAERLRQIEAEGYSPAHDDKHTDGELALAAAMYAIPYDNPDIDQDDFIGLQMALEIGSGWTVKPDTDKRRRLVKAAALIVAEVERLDRAANASASAR